MRGRSLLAAGLACLVSAVALGELDLIRVGTLLLVLPLAAAAFLAATRLRLECVRSVEPRRISAGALVQVTVHLHNAARRPTPALFAEDLVLPDEATAASAQRSGEWASIPRFALDRLDAGESRTLTYSLRPPQRGLYDLGPLTVRLCDPFGFCELPRTTSSIDQLLVTPEVVPLPRLDPTGRWSAGATARGGRAGGIGDDDLGTRPYRPGDELRRVHWRTTARVGELSVRREEQPRQGSVTLILDTRASAWGLSAGNSRPGSFETAVSVTASIAVALSAAGTQLRLVTLDGDELATVPGGRWGASPEVGALLERLATVQLGGTRSGPPPGLPAVASSAADLPVAVVGRWRASDRELLPLPLAGGLALCVGDSDLSALTSAGFRAAAVDRLGALPAAWQQLASGGAAVGQRPGAEQGYGERGYGR